MLSVSEPVDNAAQRPPMEEPALWQHKAGGSLVWEDYSQEHGAFLEAARAESKASIELSISCRSIDRSIHRLTYTIDLSKMTQTNAEDPQRVRDVRRLPRSAIEKEATAHEATAKFLSALGDVDLAAEYNLLLGKRRVWRGRFSSAAHNPQSRMEDWGCQFEAELAVLGSSESGLLQVAAFGNKSCSAELTRGPDGEARIAWGSGKLRCVASLDAGSGEMIGKLPTADGASQDFTLKLL